MSSAIHVETTLVPTLVRIVAILGLLLACVGGATSGLAAVQYRSTRRAEALRTGLRPAIVERLSADEPEWNGWIECLSEREREVLLELAEGLLRNVRGAEATKLRRLVGTLGVNERRLYDHIESGEPTAQHQALTWSMLLEYRFPPDVLLEHASRPRSIRLAAARTLYETNESATLHAALRLLVQEGNEPLSVFGIDTLYRIANDRPDPLLDRARSDASGWDPAFLVQVLAVVRQCVSVVSPSSVVWIEEYVDHGSTDVREAAVLALGAYAWHPDVRNRLEFECLVDDPSAAIRRATYIALDSSDGSRERELLAEAARTEEDDRARLVAIRLLHRRNDDPFDLDGRSEELDPATARTLAWVVAESKVRSNDVRTTGAP